MVQLPAKILEPLTKSSTDVICNQMVSTTNTIRISFEFLDLTRISILKIKVMYSTSFIAVKPKPKNNPMPEAEGEICLLQVARN